MAIDSLSLSAVQPPLLGELPGPVEDINMHPQKKYGLIIAMVLTVCSALVVAVVMIYLVVKRMRSCELCTVA